MGGIRHTLKRDYLKKRQLLTACLQYWTALPSPPTATGTKSGIALQLPAGALFQQECLWACPEGETGERTTAPVYYSGW